MRRDLRAVVTDNWVSFELDPPDADEMARRIAGYGASHAWLVRRSRRGRRLRLWLAAPQPRGLCELVRCRGLRRSGASRQGIGRALYAALLPLLADKGFHAAFAGIALPNEASVGLHEAMGFTPVGIYREVGWKLGGWRDVGWWQRLL